MPERLNVGMAEIKVAKGPATFVCLGLGSCVGVAMIDPFAQVAGMVHVMLPAQMPSKPLDKPGKFADTGIPALLEELERKGASKRSLRIAYAGGAQVFKFGGGAASKLDVGKRNGEAVERIVSDLRLRVMGADLGGSSGRTLTLEAATGVVSVRAIQQQERVLCNLKEVRAA